MKLKIKLDDGAYLPERAHPTDAGIDLKSTVDAWIHPGEYTMIDTGVHVQIPVGYVGQMTSKSSLMAKALTSRGTIDAGYTGSIRVILFNHGKEGYKVNKGDKISQLIIIPIETPEIELVSSLEETERGDGSFGNTGR